MKIQKLGKEILNLQKSKSVAIITDSNVALLYLEMCEKILTEEGIDVHSFIFPAGEEHKSPETYIDLLTKLAKIPLTRSDGIVALGGGVVGDMAGFVAATYLRGINVYQVPTTLLAAVDSSVGGKTGIDLPQGKNLVGAFHMPTLVLQDTFFLKTLPDEIFKDGCAEVIKYGLIADADLFNKLKKKILNKKMLEDNEEYVSSIISRCVEIKNEIVLEDEKDNGRRQILNFGHTIGHAIEKLSDYTISHGLAVAKGMMLMSRIAEEIRICSHEVVLEIEEILTGYGFNLEIECGADEISNAIGNDKKRRGSEMDIILPEEIGKCRIERIGIEKFSELLKCVIDSTSDI